MAVTRGGRAIIVPANGGVKGYLETDDPDIADMDAVPVAHLPVRHAAQRLLLGTAFIKMAGEQCRDHGLRRTRRAVFAFHRHGDALFRQGGNEDAFRAGLGKNLARRDLHQLRAGTARASHVKGFGHAGLDETARGLRALCLEPPARRHFCKAMRQPLQRHGIGRDGAAIHAAIVMAESSTCQACHRRADFPLQRVVITDIAFWIRAGVAAGADEAGMFAGAVIVKRRRLLHRSRLMDDGLLVRRPVRAAFQRIDIPARFRKHGGGELCVGVLPGMGGTGKRKFAVAETVGIRRTAFHQRQRLHGLAGRTRENAALDIASGKQDPAIAIHHHGEALVTAFDEIAPEDFDGNGIVHSLSLKKF
ncbi:hypothetical protein AT6N2_C1601 [Agrobacterium tumefaciens]|nr:hypothetical protein AT6N2_C1601 [Agrobacterium tumefaciens]